VGGLADVVRSPVYATGVGLALYGARQRRTGAGHGAREGAGRGRDGFWRRLAEWFGEIF
jgi:cell division protein FtsA